MTTIKRNHWDEVGKSKKDVNPHDPE
jgi:hypothetical protein